MNNNNAILERDSIKASFEKQVEKVDSLYFEKQNQLYIDTTNTKVTININTASLTELQKINGIGPVTASKIIDYRNKVGKFDSLKELKKVKGIGDKTLEKIKGEVTIE